MFAITHADICILPNSYVYSTDLFYNLTIMFGGRPRKHHTSPYLLRSFAVTLLTEFMHKRVLRKTRDAFGSTVSIFISSENDKSVCTFQRHHPPTTNNAAPQQAATKSASAARSQRVCSTPHRTLNAHCVCVCVFCAELLRSLAYVFAAQPVRKFGVIIAWISLWLFGDTTTRSVLCGWKTFCAHIQQQNGSPKRAARVG